MSAWQPERYDPTQHDQRLYGSQQPPPRWDVQRYPPQGHPNPPQPYRPPQPRQPGLTAAQQFWYVLGCIPLGAAYFSKIPAKKALADFGMAQLTGAEAFWYILMCIPFGAGYFAKLSTAKALSEIPRA